MREGTGAGAGVWCLRCEDVVVIAVVVVVSSGSSLHPNQPQVLHDVVSELLDALLVVVVVIVVVVDSSKHPNQPGVLHVSVLVLTLLVLVLVLEGRLVVPVGSVPLLSKNCQG